MNLPSLQAALAEHSPHREAEKIDRRRSAVTLLLREENDDLQVFMIQRAEREGDPWSGHMAFPGGRMDPEDASSYAAAVRECWEEVGFEPEKSEDASYIGRLSEMPTHVSTGRHQMYVTPFVFWLTKTPNFETNYEVADTIWVPLTFLANADNREKMRWQRHGYDVDLPCYIYESKRIWGLSLGMLDELLGLLN